MEIYKIYINIYTEYPSLKLSIAYIVKLHFAPHFKILLALSMYVEFFNILKNFNLSVFKHGQLSTNIQNIFSLQIIIYTVKIQYLSQLSYVELIFQKI